MSTWTKRTSHCFQCEASVYIYFDGGGNKIAQFSMRHEVHCTTTQQKIIQYKRGEDSDVQKRGGTAAYINYHINRAKLTQVKKIYS